MMLKSLNNLHVVKVALSLSPLAARAEILSFLLPRAKVLQTRALIDRKRIAVVCKFLSLWQQPITKSFLPYGEFEHYNCMHSSSYKLHHLL
jgi:hypothetical protein